MRPRVLAAVTPFAEPDISSKAIEGLYFISLLFKGLNNVLFSVTFTISNEEGEDKWIVSGTVETTHSFLAGEHSILNVGQRVSVHRRVILVGAAEEWNISVHISREVFHIRLPGLVPVRVRAARELHMEKNPVFEYDAEGVGTPIKIPRLLSHIDTCPGSLDGIPGLIECRIERLDEDGNLALVIEVRELLQTDRVLVLNPRFDGRTAVIVPGVGRIHVAVLERQYDARDCAAINAEVRHVNLQHIHALICRIRGVIRELGVKNHVILRLVVLELDGACSEVVAGTYKHSRINRECPGQRPR